MSQDLNIKHIEGEAIKAASKLKIYASFLAVVIILLIYSFLVYRVSVLSQVEPDDTAVAEKFTAKRLKIDQNSVDKLEQLEDQNVGVQSLFESARENPFQD